MPRCLQLAAEESERLLSDSFPLIDDFLCRALRGEPARWSALDGLSPEEFLDRCRHHGVSALLFHASHEGESWACWPAEVRRALEQASRAGVAQELLSRHYLKHLVQAFAERDIPCLLLKGEALAASLYPDPGTRTRSDSDLFIRICDIAKARQAVLDLAYEIVSPVYKSHQFTVMRPGDQTGNVRFDIHWRISNAARFARALSFAEVYRDSVEVPGMAPARMLGNMDALLVACMHRCGSDQHDADRLIWIHDIHALTQAMDSHELLNFADRAVQLDLQTACLDGLLKSKEDFASEFPERVTARLKTTECKQSLFRTLKESQLQLFLYDWKELAGSRSRVELLKELFLPSGAHLMHKYGKNNKLWLPLLYVRQIVGGLYDRLIFR